MKFNYIMLTLTATTLVLVIISLIMSNISRPKRYMQPHPGTSCDATTCGAIDPVNEPRYNIEETIKNTLLIEDHLANKNKYCLMCIKKHLLLNISYLQEAIWMACDHVTDYPKLEESEVFFKEIFERWSKNTKDENVRLQVLKEVRDWRREMMEIYYKDESH